MGRCVPPLPQPNPHPVTQPWGGPPHVPRRWGVRRALRGHRAASPRGAQRWHRGVGGHRGAVLSPLPPRSPGTTWGSAPIGRGPLGQGWGTDGESRASQASQIRFGHRDALLSGCVGTLRHGDAQEPPAPLSPPTQGSAPGPRCYVGDHPRPPHGAARAPPGLSADIGRGQRGDPPPPAPLPPPRTHLLRHQAGDAHRAPHAAALSVPVGAVAAVAPPRGHGRFQRGGSAAAPPGHRTPRCPSGAAPRCAELCGARQMERGGTAPPAPPGPRPPPGLHPTLPPRRPAPRRPRLRRDRTAPGN